MKGIIRDLWPLLSWAVLLSAIISVLPLFALCSLSEGHLWLLSSCIGTQVSLVFVLLVSGNHWLLRLLKQSFRFRTHSGRRVVLRYAAELEGKWNCALLLQMAE